jgi:aryl-alcohol dehydrogenase-like predicted oxidoreductase
MVRRGGAVEYRTLGQTGIRVSAIAFGAGNVGGGVLRGTPEERRALVQRVLDRGINWFDTAPAYGDGESESNLGHILRALGADPDVSTKVRLGEGDLGDIRSGVLSSVRASLARLQRESVTLIQLHNRIAVRREWRHARAR